MGEEDTAPQGPQAPSTGAEGETPPTAAAPESTDAPGAPPGGLTLAAALEATRELLRSARKHAKGASGGGDKTRRQLARLREALSEIRDDVSRDGAGPTFEAALRDRLATVDEATRRFLEDVPEKPALRRVREVVKSARRKLSRKES